MSTTLTAVTTITHVHTHLALAAARPAVTPAGGTARYRAAAGSGGIIDLATVKLNALTTLFRLAAAVAGIGGVVWQAVKSGFAMARIVVAAITAVVLVYVVWNITDWKNRTQNEVNSEKGISDQLPTTPHVLALGTPVRVRTARALSR